MDPISISTPTSWKPATPRAAGTCSDGFAPRVEDPQAVIVAQAREAALKAARLDGLEFKMLLVPEQFEADEDEAVAAFWDQVEKAADLVETETEPLFLRDKSREVTFLDTPDHALRADGLSVRLRERDGEPAELTLKVRSPRREVVDGIDTSAGDGFEDETKIERDVTCGRDVLEGRYAKSTSVSLDELRAPGQVFPLLADRGPLAPVNGKRIEERNMKLGRIHLAKGVKADAVLSFWKDGDRDPALVEFSFRYAIDDDTSQDDIDRAERKAERLLLRLRQDAREWVGEGGTKTDYVYAKS